jgi:hypothetical protein
MPATSTQWCGRAREVYARGTRVPLDCCCEHAGRVVAGPSVNTDRGCLGRECGRLRLKHLTLTAVSIPCSVMFKVR